MRLRWVWFIGMAIILLGTWLYGESNRLADLNNAGLGNPQNAEDYFYAAQVHAPDESLPYYNYASILIDKNDWSKAEQALLQAIRRGDESVIGKAYYNLGNLYLGVGEYELAIDAYQQALRINPDADNARHNLELTLQRANQPTPTPNSATIPPTPTAPPSDGETPNNAEGDGSIIEPLPTEEPFGAMSLEEAENLLDQLRLEEQALGSVLLPEENPILPEKDW
ncbi:MAG: tetratricopeptide repeat protein [Anaerolineae bacterium]|nr:tetratricopeptide repeat protein [Anaerolineae bacterium]